MSISWNVIESVPLSPDAVVRSTAVNLERLTGHDGWTLRATGRADATAWSWPLGVNAVEVPPTVEYDFELTAELGNFSGTATVDSGQEIEDDGSPVSGHAYVEVISARDQASVAVSVAAALSVFELSRGDFSGTGFHTWYPFSRHNEVLVVLGHARGTPATLAEGISRVARALGLESLPVQWP